MSGHLFIPSSSYNRKYDCYDIEKFIDEYKDEIKTISLGLSLWNLELGEIERRYIHPKEKFYVNTNGTNQFLGDENSIIVIEDYINIKGELVKELSPFISVYNIELINNTLFPQRIDLEGQYNDLVTRNEKLKWYRLEGKRFISEFNNYMKNIDVEILNVIIDYYNSKEFYVPFISEFNGKKVNVFYDEPFNTVFTNKNRIAQILFSESIGGTYPIQNYVCDVNDWEVGIEQVEFNKLMIENHIKNR
jgi:hypothetical protein